ncbi:NUDIX hydrolase [Agrococcus sp. SGAir0287]|uniref:NUDIX hydrolase n=1 Tax=Agrococcus sp. SGAir0287 TaxID=2070347 RepID=UPI0010CCE00C|nr:NUDIX domain-containing protein [Agrococcus sp. SGAir0287]QCR18041.1 DNA mismatch repair protein MutT [Agrococcus sp. SGAir0287]
MRIRAAAYCVITRGSGADEELLLSHWRDGSRHGWTLPGGGIEAGEHPEQAAVREVLEETGYHARLTGLLGVDSIVIPAADRLHGEREPLQGLRIVYSAEITGGELTIEVDGSSDDAGWHRLADVPTLRRVSLVDAALAMRDGWRPTTA